MARRVYFSFQPESDRGRAARVRAAQVMRGFEVVGFFDPTECAALRHDPTRDRRIAARLDGTSVTVVLIGTHTASCDWVQRELALSIVRGNALLGLRIHHVPDQHGGTGWFPGATPSLPAGVTCPVFEWDPGLGRLGREIEGAGRRRDARWERA